MPSGSVLVQRLLSSVTVLFKADQRASAIVFRRASAEAFAKRMQLRELNYTPGDRPSWLARTGVAELSPSRRIVIEEMVGNEHELLVNVEGVTADALDVLRDVWAVLCEFAEQEVVDVAGLGSYLYSTTAIVQLPRTFEELVPVVGVLRRETMTRLGSLVVEAGAPQYRVSVKVHIALGSIPLEREVVLEPRFTSQAQDRIFFTVSPLPSEDHLATLEALFPFPTPA